MSDDRPARPTPPFTAASIAEAVRRGLGAADLETFAALLSPDVHWGPPGVARPPCRNRDQVLAWYAKGREQGRRATVGEVEVHGDALLVGLRLDDGQERWQVLRVGPEGINDIRGFEDSLSARQELGF
jgi:hypothetical protein